MSPSLPALAAALATALMGADAAPANTAAPPAADAAATGGGDGPRSADAGRGAGPGAADAAPADPGTAAVHAAQAAERAARAAQASAKSIETLVSSGHLHGDDLPPDRPLSAWTYSLTLNAMAVGGNANARSGKLTAGVDGHWRLWSLELRLAGAYGETFPTAEASQLTALNGTFQARGERLYTAALGTYLLGGAATDHIASIAYQAFGEAGISLIWWEQMHADWVRSRLRTNVGFRVTRESRYQFIPVRQAVPNPLRTLLSPTVGANFRFGFTPTAFFTQDIDLQQDVNAQRDLRLRSLTGLTAQITQNVALSLNYTVRRVGAPAPGKQPTDTELASGITWSY